ncbi:MAG TPA: PAS domain S-box protein, partial [Methylocella sp.]|nr:PAS domain S-box protein [Methylocella sp.]
MTQWLSAKALLLRERADDALIALVSRRRPLWWRYGIGILAIAIAVFVRMVVLQELGPRRPYITFYPAVTIAALIGGLRAGTLATVLSALTAALWIEPPTSASQWLALSTFLFSCALITGASEAMHRAQARAVASEEQAKLMAAVHDSEARLQLFVSYAPGALAMFDREMRYIAVSRRWLTESGLEGRDLRGLSHYDLYPDIPDRWREIHRRALNGEVLGAEEEPFRRTDGVTQWVRWEMRPWHGADGQVAGVLVVSVDITARKQTEQALKDREEHLRAVFEAAVDAIFAIDEKGLIPPQHACSAM